MRTKKLIATMRPHDWIVVALGFEQALDMPEEANRIREEFDRQCTPRGPNPATISIEFPIEFAGGRSSYAHVLRLLAGPIPIDIREED